MEIAVEFITCGAYVHLEQDGSELDAVTCVQTSRQGRSAHVTKSPIHSGGLKSGGWTQQKTDFPQRKRTLSAFYPSFLTRQSAAKFSWQRTDNEYKEGNGLEDNEFCVETFCFSHNKTSQLWEGSCFSVKILDHWIEMGFIWHFRAVACVTRMSTTAQKIWSGWFSFWSQTEFQAPSSAFCRGLFC